jgi:hypothetical protein
MEGIEKMDTMQMSITIFEIIQKNLLTKRRVKFAVRDFISIYDTVQDKSKEYKLSTYINITNIVCTKLDIICKSWKVEQQIMMWPVLYRRFVKTMSIVAYACRVCATSKQNALHSFHNMITTGIVDQMVAEIRRLIRFGKTIQLPTVRLDLVTDSTIHDMINALCSYHEIKIQNMGKVLLEEWTLECIQQGIENSRVRSNHNWIDVAMIINSYT